ncbi:MAG: archaeal heat shock protein Hsp20 [Thermoproteota archaeon]
MADRDRWWKKKKKKDPWFDIFREFDRIDKMMDEMMRRSFEPFKSPKREGSPNPKIYGFSLSVGPEGKPRVKKFGNLKKGRKSPHIKEERAPLVDVLEEGEEVMVIVELPGVAEEDIDLKASEESLTIQVDTPEREYHRKLSLPVEVNPKKYKTSYKNGVLQVRFKKKKEEKIHLW